ncbi:MAG: isoprenylcysteine carboxylmethyltransferase family protein [Magnetospirillum sp.]|nr:isoprenylcysteine carboxylmethyltransferase family protein [Magnetospirillum sp.]
MAPGVLVVAAIAAQRLAELAVSRRNTARLLARGAHEVGRGHYPLFVLLHASWLAAVARVAASGAAVVAAPLAALGMLMAARLWVMASLGPYWTTRIITLPGAPLVSRGPYRLCRHPNYCVVAGEIAALPLAFGAWRLALAFSLANALLVAHRVRVETAALADRQ